MSEQQTKNVTAAKPQIGGAVFSAEAGTDIPTDALTELDDAFNGLGYISDEALTNEYEKESEIIKAWGGDTVLVVETGTEDNFTYKLLEALNVNVLKEVYGADNVEGDLDEGITVKVNNKELPEHPIVIDMILKDNVLKRIVIPNGKVREIGEIEYDDEDAVGYELTVTAIPDEKGNTHYEYIQKSNSDNSTSGKSGGQINVRKSKDN